MLSSEVSTHFNLDLVQYNLCTITNYFLLLVPIYWTNSNSIVKHIIITPISRDYRCTWVLRNVCVHILAEATDQVQQWWCCAEWTLWTVDALSAGRCVMLHDESMSPVVLCDVLWISPTVEKPPSGALRVIAAADKPLHTAHPLQRVFECPLLLVVWNTLLTKTVVIIWPKRAIFLLQIWSV